MTTERLILDSTGQEIVRVLNLIKDNVDVNSLHLTGTPTAPTPDLNSNNTQIATTAFVRALIEEILPNWVNLNN